MTVWTATKETPKELVDMARVLLSAVGDQIQVMVGTSPLLLSLSPPALFTTT